MIRVNIVKDTGEGKPESYFRGGITKCHVTLGGSVVKMGDVTSRFEG